MTAETPRTDAIKRLLTVIDIFLTATKLAEKTVSFRIFGDSKTITQLRTGADITTGRLEMALTYMSDKWPDDTRWPKIIARPRADRRQAA
jgi:hypothetical protein